MLGHVFDTVYNISRYAGVYALTLNALNEGAAAFYQALGFREFGPTSRTPLMLLPIQSIVDLVSQANVANVTDGVAA